MNAVQTKGPEVQRGVSPSLPGFDDEYLSRDEARKFVRLSETHWDTIQNPESKYFDSTFPPAYRITKRLRLWSRRELVAWIQSRREVPFAEAEEQSGGAR